ncbi:MAG: pyridoxamine 5'-phosphate oxidase [Proteobacteria bacterium]|nr:pyridoxamine 5'-phosphate oxidase [Pseudomonadota bacterium]
MAHIVEWLAEAEKKEALEPAAMSVATVDAEGRPSLRMVLLRGIDERGLVFYTNLTSRKADDIRANAHVALCLHWKSMARQVRVEGVAAQVDDAEADAYFASRPRDSQIGAWASKQSHVLEGRFALEARVAKYAARYAIGAVPRPEFWSGFRVTPQRIEFWEDRPFRLHERTLWELGDGAWSSRKLYP